MTALVRGANAPLRAARVTVTHTCAAPADLSALLVGRDLRVRSDDDLVFYNAPVGPGVRWSQEALEIDLAALPSDVHAVLVALSLGDGAPFSTVSAPTVLVDGHTFVMAGLGDETALVALELYRRAGEWKVRAVGQGYASGLAALLADHGVDVEDPGPQPPAPRILPDPPTPPLGHQLPPQPAPHTQPGGQGQHGAVGPQGAGAVPFVDRVWMVWEDASRSLDSYRGSLEHALGVRDQEVTGNAPRGRAQQLMDAGMERLTADMAQLAGELAAHEGVVGAEVSPFSAPSWLTWQPSDRVGEGLLLGHLDADEVSTLRVPLILRVPFGRPVWIDRGSGPGDAAAFAWSLVTRFLAAVPPGAVALDVIDPTGLSGAGWLNALPEPSRDYLCGGGVAVGPEVGNRLDKLLNLVDLRAVGGEEQMFLEGAPPVRLVVVFDVGAALEEHGDKLIRLAKEGPPLALPVICVETDTPTDESVRAMRIKMSGSTLPPSGGTLSDPWVGGSWTLTPDLLPDGSFDRPPALLTHVLNAHARVFG
ncbi:TerD family protein [Actinocorallia sp. A-T 12471]|uniref:TerD family protein n=1 Tax=Actinocorallia sp. A-T 12471 TaxID=3089813 RepID=UPI0029D17845|nr:TerD family protein [Actinocorallia sp. A-T 12471]MDX6738386.1 TerD family protein [Actinocorallia sp. A-T 12471]